MKSINDANATGAGRTVPTSYAASPDVHTVLVTWTGTVTALTVALEGAVDNSTWFVLASHALTSTEISESAAMFHVLNKNVTSVRANITSLSKTGTVAIDVSILTKRN